MDLILKPTVKCNFRCTFCSSTQLSDDDTDMLDLERVFAFLEKWPDTNTIILNGGDPLVVDPQYYRKLLIHLDEKGYKASVSFTTNLYPFYKNPLKWLEIFKHPRVGVATSFQYGDGRRMGNGEVYTEEEFVKVMEHFNTHVGYYPQFIAVMDDANEHTAVRTVELAKRFGVICKVNYANASGPVVVKNGVAMGNEGKPYVQARVYERYLEIIKAGLGEWEHNCIELMQKLRNRHTVCPLNRRCDEGIRALQPDGKLYSCGAFGDDREYEIDFEVDGPGNVQTPLQNDIELLSLKQACFTCPMFEICNGCRKNIKQLKQTGLVETHCRTMKKIAPELLALVGSEETVTEYVDESVIPVDQSAVSV